MKQILSMNYAIIGDEVLAHPSTIFTDDEVDVKTFDTEEQLITYIAGMGNNFSPLPEIGEWCEMNLVYQYGEDKVKCLQSHNRISYPPEQTPALFLIIHTVVGYPVWVQPTGAHDAYQIGDIVHYPAIDSPLWISKINANTTVPDGDIPYNRYWELYSD
jgi:hypothetical protein